MVTSIKQIEELVQALRTQVNSTFGGHFDAGVYSELDSPLKDCSLLLKEVNGRGEALLSKLWTSDKELIEANEQLIELFQSFCGESHYLSYITNTRNQIDHWWQEHPGTYFNTTHARTIATESFYQAFNPAISGVVALEDIANELFGQVNIALADVNLEKGVYAGFCQPLLQIHKFSLMLGGEGTVLDLPLSKRAALLSKGTLYLPTSIEHAQKYTEVVGWKLRDYSKLIEGNKQRNKFYLIPTFETEQAQKMAETAFHEAFKETRESYHHLNLDPSVVKVADDEN